MNSPYACIHDSTPTTWCGVCYPDKVEQPSSNERIDGLLKKLDRQAHDFDVYHGLPTWDAGQMAIMREAVREWLAVETCGGTK